jgi:heme exporter protein C
MKKNWWKWLGVILLAYALAGGLFNPLKTGITGVRIAGSDSFVMISGVETKLEVDIYNFGSDFTAKQVLLGKGPHKISGKVVGFSPEGTLTVSFTPAIKSLGFEAQGPFNLYVNNGTHWMAFPGAVVLKQGPLDTSKNAASIQPFNADPDLIKGFPNRPILNESIRNLLYHVPMWFTMITLLSMAAWFAIKYLRTGNLDYDLKSDSYIRMGILTGILGCITGMFWARVTWAAWWPRDPKLNGVAIGMLMYLAYMLLRSGLRDEHQRARIGAVYNLFVFPIFIALIWVMPKLAGDSLHPGAGGTVTFKQYDMDNTLRAYFYPAVLGWILLFSWMSQMLYRYRKLEIETIIESES